MAEARLQKILADAGIASRRKAEDIILSGRVRVNGKTVRELGTKADPSKDRIDVDGQAITAEQTITVLMNKPRGVVCTLSDPEGRQTIREIIHRIKARIYPVGRLDYNTSGALLLTNDGELAHALTHPRHKVPKTYLVKFRGAVGEPILEKWRNGIELEDGVTKPAEVFRTEEEDNFTWLQVTIYEGRNRQIRRMAEATGLDLVKLKRLSFADLTIDGLRIGEYRDLTGKETMRLRRDYLNPAKKVEDKRKLKSAGNPDEY